MSAPRSVVAELAELLGHFIDERIDARLRRTDAPHVHSQRDGERPIGCGTAKFLRAWHRGRAAGDAECWAEGRARLMTAAAWRRLNPIRTSKPPKLVAVAAAPRTIDDELLEQLGARRVGGSR